MTPARPRFQAPAERVKRAMYVNGDLFLVQDGNRLLEPINGELMETGHRPDADVCFGRQVNFARDEGGRVEVRSWSPDAVPALVAEAELDALDVEAPAVGRQEVDLP